MRAGKLIHKRSNDVKFDSYLKQPQHISRFFSDGSIHHQRDILTGGRHPRLGEESPVDLLDSYLIGEIVILAKPPPPQHHVYDDDGGYGDDGGYDTPGEDYLSVAFSSEEDYSSEEDEYSDRCSFNRRSRSEQDRCSNFVDLVNLAVVVTSELIELIESAWSEAFQTFLERLKEDVDITEAMEGQFETCWYKLQEL